ncbi:MAG: hypothetical protein K6A78_10185 [Prevotella sp.]|nr:hypothetical protein [Prevotella sp.]
MNNNYHPRRICSSNTTWVSYAYVHIHRIGEPSSFILLLFEIGDFVLKE